MSQPKEQLERKFGELAVEFGYLSQDSLHQALLQQHRLGQQQGVHIPLGELLRNNGALTDRQSRRILGLQTGCQKLGNYRLVRKLGAGGMGSVYEARQEVLNRPVALKILAQHIASNPLAVTQFHREAQLVAKLDHPNIVSGIDVGVDQGVHYFAMELVPGQSLGHLLIGGKRLRLHRALYILREVAHGLAHAHSRGVIHRDIKPGNILVYKNGSDDPDRPAVKITDLGLAQTRLLTAEDRRNIGWNMGTPHYLAPEQAAGDHTQDFRVDIYALGLTFYRLVTGREPFEGMPYHAIRDAHLTSTLMNPGDILKSSFSAAATNVLRRMTAKNPRDRYDTYAALIADLTALIEGRPVTVPALGADLSSIRPPLEVYKPKGGRRPGTQPLPTPGSSAARVALNGHAAAPANSKLNGMAQVKLPSGFVERYKEVLDPKLKVRNTGPLLRVTRAAPLTPVDSPHKDLHGTNGSHSRIKANGTTGTQGTKGRQRPSRLNGKSRSGSALVPAWLKGLLNNRDEAERDG